jgi:hypothetical protein
MTFEIQILKEGDNSQYRKVGYSNKFRVNFQTATSKAACFSGNDKKRKDKKNFISQICIQITTYGKKNWFTHKHKCICRNAANINHKTDKLPN